MFRVRGLIMCGAVAVSLAFATEARAQGANTEALAKRGKSLWQNRGCSGCHAIGKKMAGPDLAGVTERRSREWINKFLTNTNEMLASDSTAKALLQEFKGVRMPEQKLSEADIDALLAHIETEQAKLKKK